MRRHVPLIVSAVLNVILAAALIVPVPRDVPAPVGLASSEPPPSSEAVRGKTQIVVRKQFFSWNEVESSDYPVYIARLRDIGCPEQTIRDIVVADVNEMYARKRLTEIATPDQQWWRYDADTNVVNAANAKVRALEQEQRALLTTLLGPNWEAMDSTRSVLPLNGPVLGQLTPEIKQAVQNIIARAQQRTEAYRSAQETAGRDANEAELARIGQQMRADLAQILNPAQLEEFLLRYSPTANELREELRGFAVTPDEFRKIFRLRDTLSQQLHLINSADPAGRARFAALAKQMEDATKMGLGPERYQAYLLSKDPAYQDAVELGRQMNASSNVVQSLYKVNQVSNQEAERIRNDPTLTPEQKEEQLRAVEQAQKAAVNQLLGIASPAPPVPPMPTPAPPMPVHSFSPGETLDAIADRYGITTAAILNANTNIDINRLSRGQPIRIPIPPK